MRGVYLHGCGTDFFVCVRIRTTAYMHIYNLYNLYFLPYLFTINYLHKI